MSVHLVHVAVYRTPTGVDHPPPAIRSGDLDPAVGTALNTLFRSQDHVQQLQPTSMSHQPLFDQLLLTLLTLQSLTGQKQMDATAIRDYFAPLQKWLDDQNKGKPVGW